jgi:outer membrane protein OmpA-like peptidoglycan-associated protein
MPEQAQRRAPLGQSQQDPPENNHALEELRQLIVAPEQEGIAEIRERMDNRERRAEDVSSVVAEAIQMRREQGDDRALAEALAPTIQETLRDSVRRDPHVLADALFPVMGPAIRKSISEALRSMIESFNEALEHSLSARGIQWRIEAFRTGKPFAEIVLMHSLLYRAEQIFLIHRETGLVLNHVVAPAVAIQDPSMVAGMLSAIQQFVKDSFDSKRGDTLGSMDVGELHVWIEEGPDAVIAAVIRGHAPSSYRLALKETLEEIQQRYAAALDGFQGDSGPFRSAGEQLTHLLEAQYKEKVSGKKVPLAAIAVGVVALALLLGWIAYAAYQRSEWGNFADSLRRQPGIAITSAAEAGGRYRISGFRDPFAADPNQLLAQAGLNPAKADLELKPFYSLDDAMVAKRAASLLAPPASVQFSVSGGSLHAVGSAPLTWIAHFEERAAWVPGVTSVDSSQLQDADVLALESAVLTFPIGSAELEPGQENTLTLAESKMRVILMEGTQAFRVNSVPSIEIIGHSDTTGVEGTNLLLSNQRADRIRGLLLRARLKPANLHPRGVGTSMPLRSEATEADRHLNRSVTFKVIFSPASPGN